MPAVAGIVYRLWARRSAGASPWPYGGVRQLGRMRGQAQGRRLRGKDIEVTLYGAVRIRGGICGIDTFILGA